MKIRKFRLNVFETNSSNTHTITIATKKDWENFKNGELYFFDEYLITFEEAHDIYKKDKSKYYDSFEEWLEAGGELYSYNQWEDDEYLDIYEESYTSPSGDELVVFGKYGRDS